MAVTHWNSLVTVKVPVYEYTTFTNFKCRVRSSFTEEITTPTFRVYKFPPQFSDIAERELVDSEAVFQECIEMFRNPDVFPPVMYIWNYEDKSPNKLPNKKNAQADGDGSSVSSAVSRDKNQAKICKKRDKYLCLCCGFFGADGLGLKSCHLYEIRAHKPLTEQERADKLESLELVDVNDVRNLVTMCEKCHSHFDSHKIAIHPSDLRWIMTKDVRGIGEDGEMAPSGTSYTDIHGKRVMFNICAPPHAVLVDRMTHFTKHPPNVKQAIEYCHFCLAFFEGVEGLASKDRHLIECGLANNAKKMDLK